MEEDKESYNSENLKKEINQIRKDYKNATEILKRIQGVSERFEAINENLYGDNGIEKNLEFIRSKKGEINNIEGEIKLSSDNISKELAKISSNIDIMDSDYDKFLDIKGKILTAENEINSLLVLAKKTKEEIDRLKNDTVKVLDNVNSLFDDIQEKVKKMQTAYENFLSIKAKIEDDNNGLEAVFKEVNSIYKDSKKIFNDISNFKDKSNICLADIKRNQKEVQEIKDNILDNFNFTNEQKEQIQKATGLIIDTSFSQTFEKRKKEIEVTLNGQVSWKNIFILSDILLLIVIVYLYKLNLSEGLGVDFFYKKVIFTSPLLILIAFSSVQYSKERDLMERYAFKSAASATIRNHIDYLCKNFEDKEKVCAFSVDAFSTIYNEPYDIKSEKKKDGTLNKFNFLSKKQKDVFGDKDVFGVNVDMIKDLKILVSNEKLFEKIIERMCR